MRDYSPLSHRDISLQVRLDDAECGGTKDISSGCSLDAMRRRICKGGHTEKADEAFRSTQESNGIDASIGDGDICEGLIRGSD
jgi:hypothetical protein